MKSGRNLILSALLAGFLPGCALLGGGSSPLDTYELSAASPSGAGTRRSRTQILIAEPSALKSLDSENIVIKPAAGEIQYLKGAQWADRLPRVVQARLAQSFQESGRLGGVGRPGEGLAIDYQVIPEIRAFEIRLGGGDRADVEIFIRILNDRNGTVRAAKSFSASAPVSGTGNAAYTAALDAAFGAATKDIVNWAISRF
ncbi:MAG: ABC-type transport auxiliary lipoprotein family protein [Mesorhizobium sp.]|nr:ABC-type transport auxiliary lipoprotein family protein [Mesorhizobium sp.]